MSLELRQRLFAQLDALVLIDPHTHINALNPASQTLADILGYHYYTELAHSAGMPREQIEEPGISPKEKVGRLIARMGPIDNTIQYSWLVEMCQSLFGFQESQITVDNWEALYDKAEFQMSAPDWAQQVMQKSKLEALFLTNDFDDPLEDFDTNVFIPCLRTDDLVFHLGKSAVQERLAAVTGVDVTNATTLRYAIGGLFQYFKEKNARACAISLPPDFTPVPVSDARADTAIAELYRKGTDAHESHRKAAANFVFWTLAQYCAIYQLPFDLMIGVNRSVYPAGVHQGMDLYDSRVSLYQYKELFNAFPQVTFPVSVLASVTNQELASYAWIFPNVVTNGHWWYSNTPTFIEHDCAARLEAVPRTKQIGYYSDMYKLEFALPKFAMYKRILAKVLAERYVIDRGWTEEQAVALGTQILRGNVDTIFAKTPMPEFAPPPAAEETYTPESYSPEAFAAGTAAVAAGAASMLDDSAEQSNEVSLADEPAELEALDMPPAVPTEASTDPWDDLMASAPPSSAYSADPDEPLPLDLEADDAVGAPASEEWKLDAPAPQQPDNDLLAAGEPEPMELDLDVEEVELDAEPMELDIEEVDIEAVEVAAEPVDNGQPLVEEVVSFDDEIASMLDGPKPPSAASADESISDDEPLELDDLDFDVEPDDAKRDRQ